MNERIGLLVLLIVAASASHTDPRLSTLRINGLPPITLEQEFTDAEEGSVLWDSSRALLAHLSRSNLVHGKRVIEIGAGTGVVGVGLAQLQAKSVVLTDKPSQLALIQRNLQRNEVCAICNVLPLSWETDWKQQQPGLTKWDSFDLIVCCDCVYPTVSPGPLVDVLLALLDLNPAATVLLASEYRPPPAQAPIGVDHVNDFFRRMRAACHVEEVPEAELAAEWKCEEIRLWRMRAQAACAAAPAPT